MTTELERLRQGLEDNEKTLKWYADQIVRQRIAIAAEEARIAAEAKSKYPAPRSRGYIVQADGRTYPHYWGGFEWQQDAFDAGNWYATEREAMVARDAWLAFNKLRKAGMGLQQAADGAPKVSIDTCDQQEAVIATWRALPPEQRAALAGEA